MAAALSASSPAKPMNHRALAAVCVLCVLTLAPFLNRPAHIDDPTFIWMARQIVDHPLDPFGFNVNWLGTDSTMARVFLMPPLSAYFIAGVSRVAGWSLFALHLAFLTVAVLAVAGTFILANRFCNRPGLAAVMMILSPAFCVTSTTLMSDPLLLCLWIWAVVFWIWGCERSTWFLVPAAIAVCAAVLTKFTAVGIIPLLALHAMIHPARIPARVAQAAALIFPAAVVLIYDAVFKHLYGVSALENASKYAAEGRQVLDISYALRAIDTMAFFGGGVLTACLVLFLVVWKMGSKIVSAVCIAALTLLLASSVTPPSGWDSGYAARSQAHVTIGAFAYYFQFTCMLGLGVVLAVQCVKTLRKDWRSGIWREDVFLIGWVAGLYVFAGFVNWTINARSILPMLPAACILVARGVDRYDRLPRFHLFSALSIGAVITLAVAMGDYQSAESGKQAANTLNEKAKTLAGNPVKSLVPKVWIVGHWGLQYYMDAEVLTELDISNPQFRAGDFVIFPNTGFGASFRADGFETIEEITVGETQWAATAKPSMGAGFYHSNGWLLPYIFGPVPKQSFLLTSVGPDSHVSP